MEKYTHILELQCMANRPLGYKSHIHEFKSNINEIFFMEFISIIPIGVKIKINPFHHNFNLNKNNQIYIKPKDRFENNQPEFLEVKLKQLTIRVNFQ